MTLASSHRKTPAARLKLALRPLRPILRPPWRLARRIFDHDRTPSFWTVLEHGSAYARIGLRLASGRPSRRIRPLRRYELLDLARRLPYYATRVVYMTVAAEVVGDLIGRRDAATALELGPNARPLVVGADAMELEGRPQLAAGSKLYVHDATVTPWPIPDRAYDLFVALQVFEHLGNRQREAFREVRRVARHAVISLPIDWQMPDPTNIHHGISNDRALEWFAPVAPTRVVVGSPGARKRLIYVFEDLPAPD